MSRLNDIQNTLRPADFSDAGNAAVFVREHCDDVIFTDSMGWLCWDGKRWERNEHKALELAEDFSARMLSDAMAEYSVPLYKPSAPRWINGQRHMAPDYRYSLQCRNPE